VKGGGLFVGCEVDIGAVLLSSFLFVTLYPLQC
jgi:hypothetical protein